MGFRAQGLGFGSWSRVFKLSELPLLKPSIGVDTVAILPLGAQDNTGTS